MPCVDITPIPLSKEPSLDRSMSSVMSAPNLSPTGSSRGILYTVKSNSQQYGDFFAGYSWTHFCCGTYRFHTSLDKGVSVMKGYMRRLGKSIGVRIAYLAVPENRPSGLGHHQIRLHWHFLIACPEHRTAELTRKARALWRSYGEPDIERYDPLRDRAYYIAKLASQSGFDYIFDNLDRIEYNGPKDLLAAAKKNPYLPQHVKATSRYDSLVLRDPPYETAD
jgi:hypothetical protein